MLARGQRFDVKLRHEPAREQLGLDMRQYNKRQEQESANQSAVKQNGDDGVADDGLFLEDVVKA